MDAFLNEIVSAVDRLNAHVIGTWDEEYAGVFLMKYGGDTYAITFDDHVLWDSEMDHGLDTADAIVKHVHAQYELLLQKRIDLGLLLVGESKRWESELTAGELVAYHRGRRAEKLEQLDHRQAVQRRIPEAAVLADRLWKRLHPDAAEKCPREFAARVGLSLAEVQADDDASEPGNFLTLAELKAACKNVGVHLDCGACAEIFYTGVTLSQHECPKGALGRALSPQVTG